MTTIEISPKLSNQQLRSVISWRIGEMRSIVTTQIRANLDELTGGQIPWNTVFTEGRPLNTYGGKIDTDKITSAAYARVNSELAGKLGKMTADSGLGLGYPLPVYVCGLYGAGVINRVVEALNVRISKIEAGEISFADEEAKALSAARTRQKLLVYDNTDSLRGAPGYHQSLEASLEMFIRQHPELEAPHLKEFALSFLKTAEVNKTASRKGLMAQMNKAVADKDFLLARSLADQLIN